MPLRADPDLKPTAQARRTAHPVRRAGHHHYSRFVGLMKVALPASAVGLMLLVAIWPRLATEDNRFQIGVASLNPTSVESLSMVNARYQGLDRSNKPFTLTADQATEDKTDRDIVQLKNPKADFMTRSGASVYVEAQSGLYHQSTKVLDLVGEVNLYQDEGNELHTSRARVFLENSTAEGDQPVTGFGPQGAVSGTGFRILDNGGKIILTGQSELHMKGTKRK